LFEKEDISRLKSPLPVSPNIISRGIPFGMPLEI
jgi:hypothetical protein